MQPTLDTIVSFLEFIVIAGLAGTALLIVLLVVISLLPKDNPLQRLLVAFTKRLAATLGLTVVAGIFEPIPGLDVLIDVAAMAVCGWYWVRLYADVRGVFATSRISRQEAPLIDVPFSDVAPEGQSPALIHVPAESHKS